MFNVYSYAWAAAVPLPWLFSNISSKKKKALKNTRCCTWNPNKSQSSRKRHCKMAYIPKCEQIWLEIKTIFLILNGNTSRCHKKHMEFTTNKQSTVFGVRVLGMSTLDHWGDQERVGVWILGFSLWSLISCPNKTALTVLIQ